MLGPRVRDVRGHQEVEGQRQGSADRKDGLARDRRVAGDTHERQLLSILVNAEVKFAVFHFLRDMIIDAPLGDSKRKSSTPAGIQTHNRSSFCSGGVSSIYHCQAIYKLNCNRPIDVQWGITVFC